MRSSAKVAHRLPGTGERTGALFGCPGRRRWLRWTIRCGLGDPTAGECRSGASVAAFVAALFAWRSCLDRAGAAPGPASAGLPRRSAACQSMVSLIMLCLTEEKAADAALMLPWGSLEQQALAQHAVHALLAVDGLRHPEIDRERAADIGLLA